MQGIYDEKNIKQELDSVEKELKKTNLELDFIKDLLSNKQTLMQAVVLSEILSKPKSLR